MGFGLHLQSRGSHCRMIWEAMVSGMEDRVGEAIGRQPIRRMLK